MKNRAYFLMLAATTLLSAPAMAAPVFMLQFGSFESREEAETHLTALRSEHSGVIGSMQTGIREVTLPPDNLTVYRTQAGPVETRATAQSICGQLASNGDDCYVVETAMAPSFATPTQVATAQPASAMPAPAAAPAPAPMALAAAPAPAPVASPAPAPLPVIATPAPLPSAMSTTALAASSANTTAPQAVPPVAMSPVPMRDPSNAAAISRVTAAPVTGRTTAPVPMALVAAPVAATAVPTPAPVASPAMQQAMDEAAAEQNAMNSRVANAPTPPDAKKEGTFWSRLNPFSSSEPEPAAPRAIPAPVAAAPVTVETPVVETPVATLTPPAPLVSTSPTPLSPLPQEAPRVTMAPAIAPAPMLPPPPAPMMGKGAISPAQSTAASLRAPAPVIAPEPTGTLQNTPPIVIGDNNGMGNVRVGEAQRVPLSQATLPVPPAPTMAVASIPTPGPALSPSATLGQKTLWAHVGQFSDAQSALAFWDQYRRSHPDFPVVRVRVTSPLQSISRGNDKVSLRVGPFAKEASIKTLCTGISEQQRQVSGDRLICGSIVDMGIASRVGGPRNGYLPGSRYQR